MQPSATHNSTHFIDVAPQSQGGSPNGATLWAVLWRRKGILLFFLLCGLGAGYWYFTQQPEVYSASALVEVHRQQTQTSTGSALEKVTDMAPTIVFIDAEVKSDIVLQSAIEIGQLNSFPGMPTNSAQMVGVLRSGVSVSPPVEKGAEANDRSMVVISYTANDPALSTAAVNAIVSAYEQYVNGRHRKSMDAVVGFFKEARDSILPQLNELEAEYTKFRGTTPLEWTANGEAVNPYRADAMKLETGIDTLLSDAKRLKSKLKLIEEAGKNQTKAVALLKEVQYLLDDVTNLNSLEEALVQGSDAEIEIQQRLVPLVIQSDLLRSQFGDNHPSRVAIEKEIAATRDALSDLNRTKTERLADSADIEGRREEGAKALLRSYVNGIRKRVQLVEEEIAEQELRLAEVRDKAHGLIQFENENASYMRRLARYQSMLDSFDSQLEKANLPLLNSGLQLNILRPAGLGSLIGPQLPRSLIIGGIAGAFIGALLGWLLDWSERTFRSPDEITQSLNLPILAHLPLMLIQRKKLKNAAPGPHDDLDPSLVVVHQPHAPSSEAIRAVRTALFSTTTKDAEYQVIQVTSALPGDGKSTVVANLAASVAGANKRVVIVDADLRRPTQESLFGIEAELGLTSVLNGECSIDDVLVATSIHGLFILPTGPKPNNPAEAVMLPEFGQLIDDLRTEFDLILVDTPPLLAVTDASNVANHVDGVMFVMRIGRNVKPMAKRATTMLRSLHVNLIGVIVNAIGDSGYSATYANAWSSSYGGQPGSEYGYGYYRYGSDRYLNASKGQSVTVRGKSENTNRFGKQAAVGEEVSQSAEIISDN